MMKTTISSTLLKGLLLGVVLYLPPRMHWQSPADASFSITATPVETTVESGSPVKIKIVTTNISNREISFSCLASEDPAGWCYQATVKNALGTTPPETALERKIRYAQTGSPNIGRGTIIQGSNVTVSLQPGESQTFVSDLARLYDFSQPGTYTITITRSADGNPIAVTSTPVKIQVVPGVAPSSPVTASSSFSLTVQPPDKTIKEGQPIGLEITTENTSTENIVLWADRADSDQIGSTYKVNVRDQTGRSPEVTGFGAKVLSRTDIPDDEHTQITSGDRVLLKPGQRWIDTIVVTKMYRITQPGDYTIEVERYSPSSRTMVKSNAVTITVEP